MPVVKKTSQSMSWYQTNHDGRCRLDKPFLGDGEAARFLTKEGGTDIFEDIHQDLGGKI